MDKAKIKRVKRNKKKVTIKEKILAGLGVSGSLLGGVSALVQKPNKTALVSRQNPAQDKATANIKDQLGKIFKTAYENTIGTPQAHAGDSYMYDAPPGTWAQDSEGWWYMGTDGWEGPYQSQDMGDQGGGATFTTKDVVAIEANQSSYEVRYGDSFSDPGATVSYSDGSTDAVYADSIPTDSGSVTYTAPDGQTATMSVTFDPAPPTPTPTYQAGDLDGNGNIWVVDESGGHWEPMTVPIAQTPPSTPTPTTPTPTPVVIEKSVVSITPNQLTLEIPYGGSYSDPGATISYTDGTTELVKADSIPTESGDVTYTAPDGTTATMRVAFDGPPPVSTQPTQQLANTYNASQEAPPTLPNQNLASQSNSQTDMASYIQYLMSQGASSITPNGDGSYTVVESSGPVQVISAQNWLVNYNSWVQQQTSSSQTSGNPGFNDPFSGLNGELTTEQQYENMVNQSLNSTNLPAGNNTSSNQNNSSQTAQQTVVVNYGEDGNPLHYNDSGNLVDDNNVLYDYDTVGNLVPQVIDTQTLANLPTNNNVNPTNFIDLSQVNTFSENTGSNSNASTVSPYDLNQIPPPPTPAATQSSLPTSQQTLDNTPTQYYDNEGNPINLIIDPSSSEVQGSGLRTLGNMVMYGQTMPVKVVDNSNGNYQIFDSNGVDITSSVADAANIAASIMAGNTPVVASFATQVVGVDIKAEPVLATSSKIPNTLTSPVLPFVAPLANTSVNTAQVILSEEPPSTNTPAINSEVPSIVSPILPPLPAPATITTSAGVPGETSLTGVLTQQTEPVTFEQLVNLPTVQPEATSYGTKGIDVSGIGNQTMSQSTGAILTGIPPVATTMAISNNQLVKEFVAPAPTIPADQTPITLPEAPDVKLSTDFSASDKALQNIISSNPLAPASSVTLNPSTATIPDAPNITIPAPPTVAESAAVLQGILGTTPAPFMYMPVMKDNKVVSNQFLGSDGNIYKQNSAGDYIPTGQSTLQTIKEAPAIVSGKVNAAVDAGKGLVNKLLGKSSGDTQNGTLTKSKDPNDPAVILKDGTKLYQMDTGVFMDENGNIYTQPNPKKNSFTYSGIDITQTDPRTVTTDSPEVMFGPHGEQLTPVGNGAYKDSQGNVYAFGTDNSVQPTGLKITTDGKMAATTIISTDNVDINKSLGGDIKAGAVGALKGLLGGTIGAAVGGIKAGVTNALQNQTNAIVAWANNNPTTPGQITFKDGNGNLITMDKFVVQGLLGYSDGQANLDKIVKGSPLTLPSTDIANTTDAVTGSSRFLVQPTDINGTMVDENGDSLVAYSSVQDNTNTSINPFDYKTESKVIETTYNEDGSIKDAGGIKIDFIDKSGIIVTGLKTIGEIARSQTKAELPNTPENQTLLQLLGNNQVVANFQPGQSSPSFVGSAGAVDDLVNSFNSQYGLGKSAVGGETIPQETLQGWANSVNQNGVTTGGDAFYNFMTQPQQIPVLDENGKQKSDSSGKLIFDTMQLAYVDENGEVTLNNDLLQAQTDAKGNVTTVGSVTLSQIFATPHETGHALDLAQTSTGEKPNWSQQEANYQARDPLSQVFLLNDLWSNPKLYNVEDKESAVTETGARSLEPGFQVPLAKLQEAFQNQSLPDAVNSTLLPLMQGFYGQQVTAKTNSDGTVQILIPPTLAVTNTGAVNPWLVVTMGKESDNNAGSVNLSQVFPKSESITGGNNFVYNITTGPTGQAYLSYIMPDYNSPWASQISTALNPWITAEVPGMGTVEVNSNGAFDENHNPITLSSSDLKKVLDTATSLNINYFNSISQTQQWLDIDNSNNIQKLTTGDGSLLLPGPAISINSASAGNTAFYQQDLLKASSDFYEVDAQGKKTGTTVYMTNDYGNIGIVDAKGNGIDINSEGKINVSGAVANQDQMVTFLKNIQKNLVDKQTQQQANTSTEDIQANQPEQGK